MSAEIDDAARQASISPPPSPLPFPTNDNTESIQNQLLELEGIFSSASRGEVQEWEKVEEARFEAYKKERRERLEMTKRGYAEQLEGFERERIRVLAAAGDGARGRGKRRVVEVRGGLEKVLLDEGGEGLEDFFGGRGEDFLDGGGRGEEEEVVNLRKGRGKTTPAAITAKRKANPAIMADEDIDDDDDEEMLKLYRRR
ncbi:hypothetical protein K440DRAFT_66987 [Wilcoxina mikolae CBS 423.85]|nr:hypothetical protein K440DRAFT_66987 [Wilcoxina mikolae CBS 423.85]